MEQTGIVLGGLVSLAILATIVFKAGMWYSNTSNDKRHVENLSAKVDALDKKIDERFESMSKKVDEAMRRIIIVETHVLRG